jgi:hypothetical protein
VPATFVIGSGARLQPATVSAPAGIPVELTVVSGDHRSHSATLHTSPPRTVTVAAGGSAAVLLAGLRRGRYRIDIDGHAGSGTLVIGLAPGP